MRHFKNIAGLIASTLIAFGCASKEEPATKALATSEAAMAEVRVEAMKFAPEELKSAEANLTALETALRKKDYDAVINGAPQLDKEVGSLKEIVVSRQTQQAAAANEWDSLRAEVPNTLAAIETRVASLSGKRLPPEVKADAFDAAKASLATMKATWAAANAAFKAGHTVEAADQGRAVQTKAAEVMGQLAMSPV